MWGTLPSAALGTAAKDRHENKGAGGKRGEGLALLWAAGGRGGGASMVPVGGGSYCSDPHNGPPLFLSEVQVAELAVSIPH